MRHSLRFAGLSVVLVNVYQPVAAGEGMRPEQRVIQDAEDSSIGADAEREDQNRAGAELPVLRQASQGVFAVAPEYVEHPPCKRIATFYLAALDVAIRRGYSFHGVTLLNMGDGETSPRLTSRAVVRGPLLYQALLANGPFTCPLLCVAILAHPVVNLVSPTRK